MAYTNSSLVAYKKLSPNHSGQRTRGIDRISPHCVVGQCTAEGLGDWFSQSGTKASSNYGIDRDGRVGLYVEEKNRSWCTSSNANDQRAVTIECASDTKEPYTMNDKVYAALITLCADICKRNGKKKLLWFADKDKSLNYEPGADEMIITVHRWFANKSCPGDWLYARLGDVAEKVTAALGGESTSSASSESSTYLTKGDAGSAVKNMQTMLIACGYSCGSSGADGDFGNNTLAALKAFQKDAGLAVDGIYGPVSKAALEKKYKTATASKPVENTAATGDSEKTIWDKLYAAIGNAYGTAGLVGNLYAESALNPQNLQNNGNTKLGMIDAQFTAAFDNGSYPVDTFIHDGYGYGLAQWTYYSRKEALVDYAKNAGKSIGDLAMQLEFLIKEIKGYKSVWSTLTSATSVRAASDAVLTGYEKPADQSASVQVKRAGYGQTYYDKYAAQKDSGSTEEKVPTPNSTEDKAEVKDKYQKYISSTSTHYISNSGHDENSSYSGGKAGDQTGTEWQLRSWYSRPWNVVLRYPDQKVALKIARLAVDAALNDKVGYDQGQRDTYWNQLVKAGYDPAKITVACEADCSAGVCANVKAAGYLFGIKALQNHGGTYTGNMKAALVKAGFKALTLPQYLTGKDYLLPGDILLNESHHTATNITVGAKVKKDWNQGETKYTSYYRVRRSWADAASQVGAFESLENAKSCAGQNPGYAVFDESGKQVYSSPPFMKYQLSDKQVKQIARLCQQEQGTVTGAKAEASLMANQLETSAARRNRYGTGAEGLYNWIRNGGWFAKAAHWMDNGKATDAVVAGVKDVLVNGNRVLPLFVDEHDCFSDIESISTGAVKERGDYVQGKTVVKNKYGSAWTFWCFPDKSSDPFGYTDAAYKAVNGAEKKQFPYLVRVSISDLNIREKPTVNSKSQGFTGSGVFTVVDESDGWGLLRSYEKKRNGWIKLSYTEEL